MLKWLPIKLSCQILNNIFFIKVLIFMIAHIKKEIDAIRAKDISQVAATETVGGKRQLALLAAVSRDEIMVVDRYGPRN
ncbi:unnamed protein product [Prunus armeniaca]|uniref:Uncharacterized protein n=1 Tax=Prunus armeniaca TaxID=36596 RepID=A0A6J5WZG7_PRUAR|nr:unnamed protein product [Prunus armeniaca]CAB4305387.1 unnamed protein product [Prunus armeniaca]